MCTVNISWGTSMTSSNISCIAQAHFRQGKATLLTPPKLKTKTNQRGTAEFPGGALDKAGNSSQHFPRASGEASAIPGRNLCFRVIGAGPAQLWQVQWPAGCLHGAPASLEVHWRRGSSAAAPAPQHVSMCHPEHTCGEPRSPSSRQIALGGGAEPRAGIGVRSAGTPSVGPGGEHRELQAELFLSLPKGRTCSCRKARACSPCSFPWLYSLADVNFGLR